MTMAMYCYKHPDVRVSSKMSQKALFSVWGSGHSTGWGACELGRQGAKVVLWRTIVYDAESMGRMHTQGLEVFSRFFTLHIFFCRSFVNVYLQQSLRSYVGVTDGSFESCLRHDFIASLLWLIKDGRPPAGVFVLWTRFSSIEKQS
jgi:hypothetical protein